MAADNLPRIARILALSLLTLGVVAAAASAADRKRADYEKFENGPYYMRLDQIVVPRLENNSVRSLLTYVLVVEFTGAKARDKARLVLPKLRDAFVRDLHILTSRSGTSEAGIDLSVAKRYLMSSSARVLGPDVIKDVMIERTITRKAG